jgi:DNA-binding NtrC family response regulator
MWGSPRTQRRKRILCAVSNEETRWLLETPLTLSGYLVWTTAKTSEALSLARCGLFDLHIVDLSLCQAENVDLRSRIRSFDEHTPILLCTSDPVLRGTAMTADGVLNPKIPERVEKAVASRLKHAAGIDRKARLAELRAIHDELRDRRQELERQRASAALRLRSAGYIAYVQEGGTRAGFARQWPDTFEEGLVEALAPRR